MKYIYIVFVIGIISCSDSKEITITDFSKPVHDSLTPNEKRGYTNARFEIKGYTNDTIKIKFYHINIKHSGKFQYKSGPMDYYGGGSDDSDDSGDVLFLFDPYKATEGNLEINYGIY